MANAEPIPGSWARDPAAFALIYREHAPRLRAYLRQIAASSQAAEDLTQEIFTSLWLRPEGFDPARGSLRGYLLGMARYQAAEVWRRSRPEAPLCDDRPAMGDAEQASVMGDALRRLPEEQRSLLWLREVEGQTYAELAVILEIPVGTVRSRLFAARRALREIWLGTANKGELHGVR